MSDAPAPTDTGTTPTPAPAPVTPAAATPAPATPAPATPAPAVAAPATDTSLLGSAGDPPAAPAGTQPAPATPDAPKPAGDPVAPQGAPDKYEFKTTDGVAIDEAKVAEFSLVAKELGLPQDAAQKLMDSVTPALVERGAQSMRDAVTAYRTDLVNQVKADKEIGGDKLPEVLSRANEAVKAYGGDELRKVLNETGLGDHPAVIRAFYKIGVDVSNAKFVPGAKQPSKGETDAATKLYGNK